MCLLVILLSEEATSDIHGHLIVFTAIMADVNEDAGSVIIIIVTIHLRYESIWFLHLNLLLIAETMAVLLNCTIFFFKATYVEMTFTEGHKASSLSDVIDQIVRNQSR